MNISWQNIVETSIPILIMGILAGMAKIIYDHRKNLYLIFKRLRFNLLPVKFNVAISLDFDEGLNSGAYYHEIKRSLLKIIDENQLSNIVIIKDFSDIKKFNNIAETEDFRNKKQLDLIIWGGFSGDKLKKIGEEIHKVDLKFTYGHPDDKEKKSGQCY